jgi:poly-beta-hydroxyalkanoate depolymerase
MLYQAYQAQRAMLRPPRTFAKAIVPFIGDTSLGLLEWGPVRRLSASYQLFALAALSHRRPSFGIDTVQVGGQALAVQEEAAHRTPFSTLLHFKKDTRRSFSRGY